MIFLPLLLVLGLSCLGDSEFDPMTRWTQIQACTEDKCRTMRPRVLKRCQTLGHCLPDCEDVEHGESSNFGKVNHPVLCDNCMTAMKVLGKLGNNITEMDATNAACGFLPRVTQRMCLVLMEKHMNTIINMARQKIPPRKICTAVGYCKKIPPCKNGNEQKQKNREESSILWMRGSDGRLKPRSNSRYNSIGTFRPAAPNSIQVEADAEKCSICLKVADTWATLNGSLPDHLMDVLLPYKCGRLSSKEKKFCLDVVDKKKTIIGQLLKNKTGKLDICASLDQCANKATSLEEDDPQCPICILLMKHVMEAFTDYHGDIIKALKKSCKHMPANVAPLCVKLIREKGHVIGMNLFKQHNETQICTFLSYCTPDHL